MLMINIKIETPMGTIFPKIENNKLKIVLKNKVSEISLSEIEYDQNTNQININSLQENGQKKLQKINIRPLANSQIIKHLIQEDIKNKLVKEIKTTQTDILVYDLTQEREINYHIEQPRQKWIKSITKISPAVKKKNVIYNDTDTIAKIIVNIDKNMLTTIRNIFITTESEKDIEFIADQLNIDACEVCEFEKHKGYFWFEQSTIINYI